MNKVEVSALFVDPLGQYPKLLGFEHCWCGAGELGMGDARLYPGPHPVVCHSPCGLWVNLATVNYARALKEPNRHKVLPAWYPGGDDGGCFASALASVRRYGGSLEHPAFSHAWEHHRLMRPRSNNDYGDRVGWERHCFPSVGPCRVIQDYWVCEVFQSAYGCQAQKRTWLLYCGKRPPFELDWSHKSGTHQVGWFDRNKPTLSKRNASATPVAFAETLIALARGSKHV